MKQSTKKFFVAAAIAAGLLSAGPANAAEQSLSARAASMLGDYIAHQGNAALIQIRHDLKKDLTKKLQPLLPAQPKNTVKAPAQNQLFAQTATR